MSDAPHQPGGQARIHSRSPHGITLAGANPRLFPRTTDLQGER